MSVANRIKIKFKVNVIDNACRVARTIHLMTNSRFAEGYKLIKEMPGGEAFVGPDGSGCPGLMRGASAIILAGARDAFALD